MSEARKIVEGLIFLSGDEGLDLPSLREVTHLDQESLLKVIDELMQEYLKEEHGIEL